MKDKKKRLNGDIRANQVQVINEEGENLWEMSLTDALAKAKAEEMDLMEMWARGDLTIVKILDYGKFLYRQKKQGQKQKQKGRSPDMKTLRITFKIWEHDLEVKRKQAEKFADGGHPLKVSLMLRGRENHYGDIAQKKIEGFVESLEDIYKADAPVKRTWNVFNVMMKPKNK